MLNQEQENAKTAALLGARDPALAHILNTTGLPPLWARSPDFNTLVQIILEQQVSLASARAVYQRLCQQFAPLTPENILAVNINPLRNIGITRQKSAYIINLAQAIAHDELDLNAVANASDLGARAMLTSIKGIGVWTANIYLL